METDVSGKPQAAEGRRREDQGGREALFGLVRNGLLFVFVGGAEIYGYYQGGKQRAPKTEKTSSKGRVMCVHLRIVVCVHVRVREFAHNLGVGFKGKPLFAHDASLDLLARVREKWKREKGEKAKNTEKKLTQKRTKKKKTKTRVEIPS